MLLNYEFEKDGDTYDYDYEANNKEVIKYLSRYFNLEKLSPLKQALAIIKEFYDKNEITELVSEAEYSSLQELLEDCSDKNSVYGILHDSDFDGDICWRISDNNEKMNKIYEDLKGEFESEARDKFRDEV